MIRIAKTRCCGQIVFAEVVGTEDDESNKEIEIYKRFGLKIEFVEEIKQMGTCICKD